MVRKPRMVRKLKKRGSETTYGSETMVRKPWLGNHGSENMVRKLWFGNYGLEITRGLTPLTWGGGVNFTSECPKPRVYSFRRTYPPPPWFSISFLFLPRFWVIFSELMAFPWPPFANLKKTWKNSFSPGIWRSLFGCILSIQKKMSISFCILLLLFFLGFLDWKKEAEMKLRGGGGRQN